MGKVAKTIKDYIILTLACFVFSVAWEGFMIPNGMSAGGFMGLCTVIQFLTAGFLPADVIYVIANMILIAVACLLFGIGFGFKSIYCILVSTLMMRLVSNIPALQAVEGQFFYIREPFLIPIVAGVIEAIGVGTIINYGGSTGGTDIIALVVNKYFPVSLSRVFLFTDIFIICSLLIVPGKYFADMIYGFEMMVTFSVMVDFVVAGPKSSTQVFIFSRHYDQIADYVINVMDRGATILKSQGWFTKKDTAVLMVLLRRNELHNLTSKVKQIDPKAFMSVSPTSFVYGEGFEEIKAKLNVKKDGVD